MDEVIPPAGETKKVHILIVDDDPVMRQLFGGKLVILGYEVIYANDGNEGREVARRLHPDLILMDERMPIMDGLEASGRLKEEEQTKDIPIILFTNEDLSIEAQKMAKDIGIDDYIHKSSDFSKLKDIIARVLEKNKI